MRSGTADLPLHGGRVPRWLSERMATMGRLILEAQVHEYGREEVLRRLSHPFWFQSFGAVMGMDWHSSGITTSVIGALKRGLAPVQDELGLYVCGGRGKHSRKTPDELIRLGEQHGLDGIELADTSRLVAKVDSAAVQDGFQLYLHAFILTADGKWAVVQQGMNGERKEARRYHWLSSEVSSFVDDPHQAIEGESQGNIINLADHRASDNRDCQLSLLDMSTEAILRCIESEVMPALRLPKHHEVKPRNINLQRMRASIQAAVNRGPVDFPDLLLTPGVGARTLEALALVAELIHGRPARFQDPARFSLAHGGKDGHPFPVPLRVYDESIRVMRQAVDRSKLGNDERLAAIKRLDREARRLERSASGPTVEEKLHLERVRSKSYGGRSVMPPEEQARQIAFSEAWLSSRCSAEESGLARTSKATRPKPTSPETSAQLSLPLGRVTRAKVRYHGS